MAVLVLGLAVALLVALGWAGLLRGRDRAALLGGGLGIVGLYGATGVVLVAGSRYARLVAEHDTHPGSAVAATSGASPTGDARPSGDGPAGTGERRPEG